MELVGQEALTSYLAVDGVADSYAALAAEAPLRRLKCQEWLEATPAKRMIFSRLYGDILKTPSRRRVVDVGGGLTALTPLLAVNSDYCLIDPLHHDDVDIARAVIGTSPDFQIERSDWHDVTLASPSDIVIANDLFPNVDQRLGIFLDWAIPQAREIRLSLTFYNSPRWYQAQRVGGDEQFCMLAFDGERTLAALAPHAARIAHWKPGLFNTRRNSVYPNGRHVVLVTLRGEA